MRARRPRGWPLRFGGRIRNWRARVTGAADVLAQGPFVFLGFVATVAGGLATLALVLAMAGLYGVLSHVVDKRRREMGVRVALGASPSRIVKLVLKDGLRPVAEGTFIGLGAALVIRQLMQLNFTESLSPIDVATFLLAAVPLTVAGAYRGLSARPPRREGESECRAEGSLDTESAASARVRRSAAFRRLL